MEYVRPEPAISEVTEVPAPEAPEDIISKASEQDQTTANEVLMVNSTYLYEQCSKPAGFLGLSALANSFTMTSPTGSLMYETTESSVHKTANSPNDLQDIASSLDVAGMDWRNAILTMRSRKGDDFSREILDIFLDESRFDGIETIVSPLNVDVLARRLASWREEDEALGEEVSISEFPATTNTLLASLLPFVFIDVLLAVGAFMLYRLGRSGGTVAADCTEYTDQSVRQTGESAEDMIREQEQSEASIQVKRPKFERPFHDFVTANMSPTAEYCMSQDEVHSCPMPQEEVHSIPKLQTVEVSDVEHTLGASGIVGMHADHHQQLSTMPYSDEELQAQINFIVSSHIDNHKYPYAMHYSDDELQAQINAIVSSHSNQQMQSSMVPCSSEDELKARINAIVAARADYRKWREELAATGNDNVEGQADSNIEANTDTYQTSAQPVAPSSASRDGLQAQINVVVNQIQAQQRKLREPKLETASDDELKSHINAIVGGRLEHRKQCEQRVLKEHADMALNAAQARKKNRLSGASLALADLASPSPGKALSSNEVEKIASFALSAAKERSLPSPSPGKALSSTEIEKIANIALSAAKERSLPSPSPTKSLSDAEVAFHANCALTAAKARNTPAKPPPPMAHWEVYDEEAPPPMAPCQLNFTDEDVATGAEHREFNGTVLSEERSDPAAVPMEVDVGACVSFKAEADCGKKAETVAFDVTQIPSPTRNRAKKQKMLAEIGEESVKESEEATQEASEDLAAAVAAATTPAEVHFLTKVQKANLLRGFSEEASQELAAATEEASEELAAAANAAAQATAELCAAKIIAEAEAEDMTNMNKEKPQRNTSSHQHAIAGAAAHAICRMLANSATPTKKSTATPKKVVEEEFRHLVKGFQFQ